MLDIGGSRFEIPHRATLHRTITVFEDTLDEEGTVESTARFDLTGSTLVFAVDDHNEELITKVSSDDEQIELLTQSGDTEGQATLKLIGYDTDSLTPGYDYFYDLWVHTTDSQVVQVIERSKFVVNETSYEPVTPPPDGDGGIGDQETGDLTVTGELTVTGTMNINGVGIYGDPFDIRDYGATLDVSQTAAERTQCIQDCLDAADAAGGGQVFIPPGTWVLTRIGALEGLLIPSQVSLVGNGQGVSVLQVEGGTYVGTFYLLHIFGEAQCRITNLTLDGNFDNIVSAHEQTHLLQIRDSSDVIVENVEFINSYGDGIRLLGNIPPATIVNNVVIDRCRFEACHRDGVTFQRGVYAARVTNCYFIDIDDQSIDFEPSGGAESDMPQYNLIANNVFDNQNGISADGIVVTLSGNDGTQRNSRTLFVNNTLRNGRIHSVYFYNLTIANNWIQGPSGDAAIDLSRTADYTIISGNHIYSPDHVGILVESASSLDPQKLIIDGNAIEAAISGIQLNGVHASRVTNNQITGDSSLASTGIQWRGTVAASRCYIHGNTVDNYAVGIYAYGSPEPLVGVSIDDNDIDSDVVNSIGIRVEADVTDITLGDYNKYGSGIDYGCVFDSGLSATQPSVQSLEVTITNGSTPTSLVVGPYRSLLTTGGSQSAEEAELGDGTGVIVGTRKLIVLENLTDPADSVVLDDANFSQGVDVITSIELDAANEFLYCEWRGSSWEILSASSGVVST